MSAHPPHDQPARPLATAGRSPAVSRASRHCLWAMLGLAVVTGGLAGGLIDNGPALEKLDMFQSLGFAVFLGAWCACDARARRSSVSYGLALLILTAAYCGLPIYLIASRGWKQGSWVIAKAIGFWLVSAVLHNVALLGVYALRFR